MLEKYRAPRMSGEGTSTSAGPVIVNVPKSDAPAGDFQSKIEKAARKAFDKGIDKGASNVLKAAGVPKEQREAMLAKLSAGEYTLAGKGEIDALKASLAEAEKYKTGAAEAELLKAKVAKHAEFFTKLANDEFTKLPESAQKYIAARAGEDPEQRLAEIQALRDSGLLAAPAAAAPEAAPTAPREPRPATTMASSGPASPSPAGKPTPRKQYEALKKSSPLAAAQFFKAHKAAIEADKS